MFEFLVGSINFYAAAPLFVGALTAVLGLAVLVRERSSLISMTFFGMAFTGALWLVSNGVMFLFSDSSSALVWAKVEHVAVVFIPSTVYLFTLSVTRWLQKYHAYARTNFLLSALFACIILFTNNFIVGMRHFWWGYSPQYGVLSVPFLVFFFSVMIFSLRLYWLEYKRAYSQTHARRLKAFLIGFCIAYVGSVDFLAPCRISVYPFGYLAVFAFLVIAGQAIWRYRLVDITPAFAAEQVLRLMADALLVFDREGIVRVANPAACHLFQEASPEDLVGKPIWMIHSDFFPKEKFETFIRTKIIHGYETHLLLKNGQKILLDVVASALQDPDGHPVAIVCIARDLTQRKEEQTSIEKTRQELLQKPAGPVSRTKTTAAR